MKKDIKIPVFNQYQTISPATKLLQKRRKMYQVHQAFQTQKQQFKGYFFRQSEANKHEIKKKDKQLQTQLTKFCQFLQQNQSKRKKAQQKSKFEEKALIEKDQQLENLKEQIKQLQKNQKKYSNRGLHLQKYQAFLDKVKSEYTDQYPQISDILARYQTLKNSTDDLIKTRQRMENLHEQLRKESLSYEKQMNQSILTINNQIKDISKKIEDKIHEKNQIQSQVQRSNQDFSNKNLNLGKIFMAIDNLFYRANQNSYRIKYEFDQKGSIERKQIKIKKVDNDHQNNKNQQDTNYEQRSKHSSVKLKGILSHMKDLKAIIDKYKTTYEHSKDNNKGERY